MSSGAIPPAPPSVTAPPAAPTGGVLTAVTPADAEVLAKLAIGTQLKAALTAADAKGMIQALTADGASLDLKLPAGLSLPANADLTLQVIQQGGLPALRLLAVNGRMLLPGGMLGGPGAMSAAPNLLLPGGGDPLAGLGQPPLAGRNPAITLGGPAGPALSGAGLLAGAPAGMTATLIRPAPAGAVMTAFAEGTAGLPPGSANAVPAGLAGLPPGTQLTLRIAAVAPPGGGAPVPPKTAGAAPGNPAQPTAFAPGPSPAAQASGSPGPGQPQPQTAAGIGTAPANAPPMPQAPLAGRPVLPGAPAGPATPPAMTASPLASAAPATAAAAVPVLMAGEVISHSHGGTSLIQTPAGLLSLPDGPALPVGGFVQLEVVGKPNLPPPPLLDPPPGGLGQGEGWPTLTSAADALAQVDRQAAEQLMRMIPQAGPRLAATLSLFAGAVRAGDIKQLVGDNTTRGLDRAGRKDLADRLKKDFLSLTEEAIRPRGGGGDWQMITMPFGQGAQIDPVRLYVQRPKDEEESGKGKGGQEQRFLLEVQMSRLGRIQFDGLIQRESKRFDLIVRTDRPLGPDICRDIAGIFAECGQLTGAKGNVGFQSGRGFVELPPSDSGNTRIVV